MQLHRLQTKKATQKEALSPRQSYTDCTDVYATLALLFWVLRIAKLLSRVANSV